MPKNKLIKTANREQQTTTTPILDPGLISTIHSNKGAIDTIRGQISELRNDVDQIRTEIKQHRIPNLPLNNEIRRISKSEIHNHNSNSFSQHHVEKPEATGSSSICILL
jgi:chromosome segregation ATPase